MKFIILFYIVGIFNLTAIGQNKWIKLEETNDDIVRNISLLREDNVYSLPTWDYSIKAFNNQLKVIALYVNQDCKRFKLTGTYLDVRHLDTSDKHNYVWVEHKSQSDINSGFNPIQIDTNSKRYLLKNSGDSLFALRYLWETPNNEKYKLQRVSGDIEACRNEILRQKGIDLVVTWWYPEKPIPTYTIENLQYLQSGDTFEVYGTLKGQGIIYRDEMLFINDDNLKYYDRVIDAFVFVLQDDIYDDKNKSWKARIYKTELYDKQFYLGTFHFKDKPKELPQLTCNDPEVTVSWKEFKGNRYLLCLTIPMSDRKDRPVEIKMINNKGQVAKCKVVIAFDK